MKICGLDEVGRGALAGPLVAGATVLSTQCSVLRINDSKKLNRLQREEIFRQLVEAGAEYRVETISARQINNRGMRWANREIFRRLIRKIEADKFIVDGNLKLGRMKNKNVKCVVAADASRKCVMAASIIAKVIRDEHMRKLHKEHRVYGWDKNAGYGTREHVEAIKKFGTVKYHRDVWVRTVQKNHFL
jgi:ribonuclease HII